MTTDLLPIAVTPADVEYYICRRDFSAFLRRVRIQEPPVPNIAGSGGVIPFEPWPHLMEFAHDLVSHRLLWKGKARQLGFTWTLASYFDWMCNYTPGTEALWLSKSEPDASEGLGRIQKMHELLPGHLVTPWAKPPTSLTLEYANGSRVKAMASTENAGRGMVYSLVGQDEADFHPYLAENYAAVKPTIDAGGQLIMLSTVNKKRMDSLFKGIGRGAPGNGWHATFTGVFARPGRDQAWYERTKANVPASEGMSPELYMEQEYPRSFEEMMAPSRAMAFFNPDAVEVLRQDCREPEMRQGGLIRIWRKPVVGGKYVGFGDVSWGHASAYSCFTLADWQTGVQVAEIYGRPEHDEYAKAIADLTTEYGKAYFGIEANGETTERSGLNVINKLIALGLGQRMYHHGEEWEKDERQRGWLTTGATRPVMLGELEEAVRLHGIVPACKDVVGEMLSFIRNEKGRPEAAVGAYADHVMSWAGLWQMRKYARYNVSTGGGGASRSVMGPGEMYRPTGRGVYG